MFHTTVRILVEALNWPQRGWRAFSARCSRSRGMQGALFEGPSPRPYHCPDCECRFEASPPPIANSTPVCPRCRGRNPVALSLAGVLGASSDAPSQILTDLLIFCTPFALVHSVGGFGAVLGALARAVLQALPPAALSSRALL